MSARDGTSHLVAISGLHMGFVAGLASIACGFVWWRFRWRGIRAPLIVAAPKVSALSAAFFAAFFAAFYATLAGFNVPAQRAFWMLSVAVAYACGRRPALSLVLCWALVLVRLADSWAVTSPGFWLSFCTVTAILFAIEARERDASRAPEEADDAFETLDWKDRIEAASSSVTASIDIDVVDVEKAEARVQYAVTLALAPLTLYWFSQIPLLGPIANAFAIPWVNVLVTPGTLAGTILPAPLDAMRWPCWQTP